MDGIQPNPAAIPAHHCARPPRLVWFLFMSVTAHAILLLDWLNPGMRIEESEQFNLLSVQLIGGAGTTSVQRPRNTAPSPASPATATKKPERVASSNQTATATHETGDTGQADLDSVNRARTQVISDFARHFHYPAIARQRGWEGRVVVGFRIERDGRLQERRVAHTSGFAVLDRAALDSLRKVERIADAGGTRYDLEIPVVYRLTDAR